MRALRCTIAALYNAAATVAVVVGAPAALLHYASNPIAPVMTQIRGLGEQPLSMRQLTPILIIFLWGVWLLLVTSVLIEAVARLRGIDVPRLPVLRPLQGMAATLIAGQAASLLTPTIATAAPAIHLVQEPASLATASAATATVPQQAAAADGSYGPSIAVPMTRTAGTITLVIDDCGYTYTVVKGDSLWRIAKQCLGDPERWPEIWKLNKGKYWPHVSGHTKFRNPDLIFPGWVLTLPADATVPPGAEPVDPPVTNEPPATTAPPTWQTPPPQLSPSHTPTPPTPSVTATPSRPATSPTSASSSVWPTPATLGSSGDTQAPASPLDGIDLPGGWITAGLGAGLLAAVAMVWKQRRHRYTATPITTPELSDADLTPPLAASTRIRQAQRRAHPDTGAEPAPAPTVRQYNAATVKPALPPVGPSGADLAGAGTLPLSAGLGLTGGGAHNAARAMLVAILSAGSPDDPDAQGRAIIPATTLATLITVPVVELGRMPRLTIAASMAEAMTLLEEEIIRRSRIIAEQEVADVAALRATDTYAEPLPQLLLFADAPDLVWQKRLATAIRLGEPVDIGAVLLGEWPHGLTLTVATDGTTSGGRDGQRLAVLETDAAALALTMLHEAYGDQPATPPPATATRALAAVRSPCDDLLDPQPATDETNGDTPTPAASPAHDGRRRAQVRVLGTPAVLDNAGQPVHKLRAKSVELLVYLTVNRNGAPLAQIMEALWPDATWRRASQRLSTCVANLRHAIRAVLADGQESKDDGRPKIEPVINSGGHYRLDPAVVEVDWWTVLDAYSNVATSTDHTAQLANLKTAIDAIGGGLADGADYEWADTDREHVRRHHIKIYSHAADLVGGQDPHQARVLLDTACKIDPLSEDLARRAMRTAATLADADAIHHRLRTLRATLDDQGLQLQPDTEQLARDLLNDLARQHPTDTWPQALEG